jgi:hemoglobin
MILLALAIAGVAQVTVVPTEQPVAPYAQSDTNADAAPFRDGSMWRAFHEGAGVARIVDATVDLSMADHRIADIFKGHDIVRLRRTLKEQFCYILGGGCRYSGRSMAAAHRDMGLQQADLSALVEHLQTAMHREHVAFDAQNRFLAKLAPMHREVLQR